MEFTNKIVVITGAAQGIGRCIRQEFEKNGAIVCTMDIQENDISRETCPTRAPWSDLLPKSLLTMAMWTI